MEMTVKILLLLAFAAHIVLWQCDRMLTYTDGGRFGFKDFGDNKRLSEVFGKTPASRPMLSVMLGTFAMAAALPGYLALCEWTGQFSKMHALLMAAGAALFCLTGTAHHIFCGVSEWIYIRMNRTEEAREIICDFFKKTLPAMYVCYAGLLLFAAALLAAVAGGITDLPRWACVFNTLPLFLIMTPLRIVGAGNLANAIMLLGLSILI